MNQDKLGGLKERIILHRLLGASAGALAVFLFGFMLIPTLISEASATIDVAAKVNWTAVSLILDPDVGNPSPTSSDYGDILFNDLIPTSVGSGNIGTQQVIKKTIGVTTTGTSYSVFLSLGDESTDLVRSGSGATASINGIAGTWEAPAAFSATSWGYATPGSTVDGASFSTTSVYSAYDSVLGQNLTKSGIGSSVYGTGLWAAAPASTASPQQIWKNTTNAISGFSSGDTFNIYYSVMVDNNVLSGSYENELVYTAFASSTSLDIVSNNIARSLRYGTGGDTETLELELTMNIPSLTKDQVEVYIVPHKITEQNKDAETGSYTAEGLGAYNDDTSGNRYKCIIGSGASDFVLDSNTGTLTLNCTIPANPDPVSTYWNYGGETMNGEYDFWVQIEDYGLNYVSQYTENTSEVASFIYAGLQTRKRNGEDFVIPRTMQSVTTQICKNTAPYDVYGLSYTLKDTRDNIEYITRKIGDDCWMVQNLRFGETTLKPSTSDVQANVSITWQNFSTASSTQPMRYSGYDDQNRPIILYNYVGASALSITGSSTAEANQSICPKGWRLPTYATARNLVNSSNPMLFTPEITHFVYADENQAQLTGNNVGYWLTATHSNTIYNRYVITYNGQSIGADTISGGTSGYGLAIRCVAR